MIHVLHGTADPRFEKVTQYFNQIVNNLGGGAALCIFLNQEMVVDIWAGDKDTKGNKWQRNTNALSYSTSKGVLAALLHLALEESQLSYDTPICKIWPSFKQNGKNHLKIQDALTHQLGLPYIFETTSNSLDIYDWDQMVWLLAKAAPSYEYIHKPAYHAISYGWIIGELVYRLTGLKPNEFLNSALRSVIGRANFFRVPERHIHQTAELLFSPPTENQRLLQQLKRKGRFHLNQGVGQFITSSTKMSGALWPLLSNPEVVNTPHFLQQEIPSVNGVFTARGLARMYNLLLEGTHKQQTYLSKDRLKTIGTIQTKATDRILRIPMHWRLGFHRVFNLNSLVPQGFGHFGYGGSGAWCDPQRNLAIGFVTNAVWGSPLNDIRFTKLTSKILTAVNTFNESYK